MVGRGEGGGEHGLLIIRQHGGVEEQYSNVSTPYHTIPYQSIPYHTIPTPPHSWAHTSPQDGHEGMVVGRHQESHTDQGIIVRHGQDSTHEGIMDLAQHSDHSN